MTREEHFEALIDFVFVVLADSSAPLELRLQAATLLIFLGRPNRQDPGSEVRHLDGFKSLRHACVVSTTTEIRNELGVAYGVPPEYCYSSSALLRGTQWNSVIVDQRSWETDWQLREDALMAARLGVRPRVIVECICEIGRSDAPCS